MKTLLPVTLFALALLSRTLPSLAADAPPATAAVTVSITASDPISDEVGPSTGLFTVRRTGPTTDSLTVVYHTGGTAVSGVDYVPLPGSITIPAGSTSASFLLTPVDDEIAEGPETVVVTLISPIQPLTATPAASSLLYEIGHPRSATVVIKENDRGRVLLPTVNIRALDLHPKAETPGAIRISRVGATSNALEVAYMIVNEPIASGTGLGPGASSSGPVVLVPSATPGEDYEALPGTVTIAAGHASVEIPIHRVAGHALQARKHVTLKLKPSSLFNINQPDTATVFMDPENQPPVVRLVTPTDGETFAASGDITLTAAATDPDGTVVKVQFFANDKSLGVVTNNPASASPINPFQVTWTNVPAGHYALTVKATDNEGRASTSAAVEISVIASVPGETLIAFGSSWKYLDNGSDQGTAWRAGSFDDSKWASGPAPLGYGRNGLATVVSYGADAKHKHVTTYLRRTFTVQDASRYSNVVERILRDDGAIVYLNGTLISHGNVPAGPITNGTLAVTELTGAAKTAVHQAKVDPKLLVNSANTIAVELHQASVTGEDIAFDFELIGNAQLPPSRTTEATLVIGSPKSGANFTAPAEIPINATAVDPKGYISRVEFFANEKSIGVSELMFIRAPDPGTPIEHKLDWKNVSAGKYTLVAKAKDSAGLTVTSPPVVVNVVAAVSPAAKLQSAATGIRVLFPGQADRLYRIQASSDLENWTDLGTVRNENGTTELLDESTDEVGHRFYRALPLE